MKFKIESSEKDYTLNYFVYYKTSFFGRWKKIRKIGYMELDKCIQAIEEFLIAKEKVDNINKEIKEKERRKDR